MARILGTLLAVAGVAVSPYVFAVPCAPGTLADYLGTDCEIGDTTFSDFELLPVLEPLATEIDAAAIQVTPLDATNPGFMFSLNADASTGENLVSLFRFQVTAGPALALFGASAVLTGGQATGDGVATLVEDLCLDGLFDPATLSCSSLNSATLIPFVIDIDADVSESLTFAAAGSLDVVANFIIDGGLDGTAALSSGTLRFVTNAPPGRVAEPPALALAALAVFLLAAFARRRLPRRIA